MTVKEILKCWARWARGGFCVRSGQENVLYRLMTGQVVGRSGKFVGLPAGIELGGRSVDAFFVEVERAIGRLPKRQREAVLLAFLHEPDLFHDQLARLMSPPCNRVTYSRHLNSALNQLANDLGVDNA